MLTIPEILASFDSLGNDGEFGLAQRVAGAEPLGFFRFNTVPLPDLIAAIDADFAGLDDPGRFSLTAAKDGEYILRISGTGFAMPTRKYQAQIDEKSVLAQMAVTVGFLLRKLRQDIAAGQRLFVRKGGDGAAAEALSRALRKRGPATLLWVTVADPKTPPGIVSVRREGVLHGLLDRFAGPSDPAGLSPIWYDVCLHAHALWRGGCLTGTSISRGAGAMSENLLQGADGFAGPGWRTGTRAASQAAADAPRLFPGSAAMAHGLEQEVSGTSQILYSRYQPVGLVPGEIFTGSLHVWIPQSFAGTLVAPLLDGFASLRTQPADLTLREQWQRIWVSARVPDGKTDANLALAVRGPAGSTVRSCAWALERGARPGRYHPAPVKPAS